MILIIDFGSQTAHLIGRRLRQLGVTVEYADPGEAVVTATTSQPTGIIFSGGPASVYAADAPAIDEAIFELGVPILGICYGWQLMAHVLGGKVESASHEYGPETISWNADNDYKIPVAQCQVIVSHGDSVTQLPPGFTVIGSTERVAYAAVKNEAKNLWGVQFHPEADHTEHGTEILEFFAETVCHETIKPLQLDPNTLIAAIKTKVGDQKVICAVSGGVDSTVAAALIGKAIGKNLIPVYVESGLMRDGTVDRVREIFTKLVPAELVVVAAEKQFMAQLKGITDPEQKRKIIGKLYVDIFQAEAKKHADVSFLGQGTIYSDVIESKGSKHASHIKSHHNVGGLPADMKLQLLEPLRHLYKDEVRSIGRLVGLPEDVVMQQPVPGPGYAVRIRGEVTPARLAQVKIADEIVVEEIKKAGLYEQVFQCFAVMSGAMSTAVKGDGRAFAEVVAVRAYESNDIMTSQWANIPYPVLQRISSRIVNEVPDVSRVVYDITTKPPATMEWE